MKLGVVFPQTEIGTDPQMIARFATTAEALGYHHIIAYDHVLGASTQNRPDWKGPYTPTACSTSVRAVRLPGRAHHDASSSSRA